MESLDAYKTLPLADRLTIVDDAQQLANAMIREMAGRAQAVQVNPLFVAIAMVAQLLGGIHANASIPPDEVLRVSCPLIEAHHRMFKPGAR